MALIAGCALTYAPRAFAALFLVFSGTQASPGAVVVVETGGKAALPNVRASEAIRVYLAPADEANAITSADDQRLVLLGRLRIDDEGNGSLRLVVPEVSPGDYTTLTHCASCAPTSAGKEILPTGPFPGSFVVLGDDDGAVLWLVVGLVGVAAAATAAVVWRRRRLPVGSAALG